MNVLSAAAIFLSVHSLVDPAISACSIGTRQPVPGSSCAQFRWCHRNGSWSAPFDCGPGTLWNQHKQTCDFRDKVNVVTCGDKTKESAPTFPCSGAGQYVANRRSRCRMFQPCGKFGNPADLITCQPGTLFVERLQKCMPARVVDQNTCDLRPSEKCTPPAIRECTTPDIRGTLQCTNYQLCTREGLWSGNFRCPPGTLINVQTVACDFAENVHTTNCLPIA